MGMPKYKPWANERQFRKLLRDAFADARAMCGSGDPETIQERQDVYTSVQREVERRLRQPRPYRRCGTCGGLGTVPYNIGSQRCPNCKGRGRFLVEVAQ